MEPSRRDTAAALASGVDLALVIDVQGARQVRERTHDAVAVFVLPPSFAVLAERLRGRNQDPPASIERRLATARAEVDAVDEYDYVVINDELERCVGEIARDRRGRARASRPEAGRDRSNRQHVQGRAARRQHE